MWRSAMGEASGAGNPFLDLAAGCYPARFILYTAQNSCAAQRATLEQDLTVKEKDKLGLTHGSRG